MPEINRCDCKKCKPCNVFHYGNGKCFMCQEGFHNAKKGLDVFASTKGGLTTKKKLQKEIRMSKVQKQRRKKRLDSRRQRLGWLRLVLPVPKGKYVMTCQVCREPMKELGLNTQSFFGAQCSIQRMNSKYQCGHCGALSTVLTERLVIDQQWSQHQARSSSATVAILLLQPTHATI